MPWVILEDDVRQINDEQYAKLQKVGGYDLMTDEEHDAAWANAMPEGPQQEPADEADAAVAKAKKRIALQSARHAPVAEAEPSMLAEAVDWAGDRTQNFLDFVGGKGTTADLGFLADRAAGAINSMQDTVKLRTDFEDRARDKMATDEYGKARQEYLAEEAGALSGWMPGLSQLATTVRVPGWVGGSIDMLQGAPPNWEDQTYRPPGYMREQEQAVEAEPGRYLAAALLGGVASPINKLMPGAAATSLKEAVKQGGKVGGLVGLGSAAAEGAGREYAEQFDPTIPEGERESVDWDRFGAGLGAGAALGVPIGSAAGAVGRGLNVAGEKMTRSLREGEGLGALIRLMEEQGMAPDFLRGFKTPEWVAKYRDPGAQEAALADVGSGIQEGAYLAQRQGQAAARAEDAAFAARPEGGRMVSPAKVFEKVREMEAARQQPDLAGALQAPIERRLAGLRERMNDPTLLSEYANRMQNAADGDEFTAAADRVKQILQHNELRIHVGGDIPDGAVTLTPEAARELGVERVDIERAMHETAAAYDGAHQDVATAAGKFWGKMKPDSGRVRLGTKDIIDENRTAQKAVTIYAPELQGGGPSSGRVQLGTRDLINEASATKREGVQFQPTMRSAGNEAPPNVEVPQQSGKGTAPAHRGAIVDDKRKQAVRDRLRRLRGDQEKEGLVGREWAEARGVPIVDMGPASASDMNTQQFVRAPAEEESLLVVAPRRMGLGEMEQAIGRAAKEAGYAGQAGQGASNEDFNEVFKVLANMREEFGANEVAPLGDEVYVGYRDEPMKGYQAMKARQQIEMQERLDKQEVVGLGRDELRARPRRGRQGQPEDPFRLDIDEATRKGVMEKSLSYGQRGLPEGVTRPDEAAEEFLQLSGRDPENMKRLAAMLVWANTRHIASPQVKALLSKSGMASYATGVNLAFKVRFDPAWQWAKRTGQRPPDHIAARIAGLDAVGRKGFEDTVQSVGEMMTGEPPRKAANE